MFPHIWVFGHAEAATSTTLIEKCAAASTKETHLVRAGFGGVGFFRFGGAGYVLGTVSNGAKKVVALN